MALIAAAALLASANTQSDFYNRELALSEPNNFGKKRAPNVPPKRGKGGKIKRW